MRVICIDDTDRSELPGKHPVVGEVCTVIGEDIGIGKNGTADCYILQEYDPLEKCFEKKNFAPLSDLDETIIHANKIKEDSYA